MKTTRWIRSTAWLATFSTVFTFVGATAPVAFAQPGMTQPGGPTTTAPAKGKAKPKLAPTDTPDDAPIDPSTAPATGPGATAPAAGPGATAPAAGPGATAPATGPGATAPATGPGATAPADGPGAIPPNAAPIDPTVANPVPGVKTNEPSTGPSLGAPDTAGPLQPRPLPVTPAPMPAVELRPLTTEELGVLKDVEAEFTHFSAMADDHDRRMKEVVNREYDERTGELEKRYAEKISKAQTDRTRRHAETLALLEKFVVDHPDNQQFTPDVMFRLATLDLDVANDAVDAQLEANPDAIADYSKSLDLWEQILAKFPQFRQLPSTLYLLAYYNNVKDPRRSLQLYLSLTCANKYKNTESPTPPPTREEALARTEKKERRDPYADCKPMAGADTELVRHAWVRGIADYHFTVPGELDDGIAAYLKVVDGGKDSPLYAESLYKLAWAYYKRDFLIDAIQKFDESVKVYDQIVASGATPALELRDESIQYIAVALTDPWDGETESNPAKAFERAKNFYKGRENEGHVRDVWVALGHAFVELQAYDQAVDSFKVALGDPWALDPHNPQVEQEIVNTLEAKGDKFAADAAAADLATRYAPGTKWFATNEKDREAMDNQHRIGERALYAAARNTHSAAATLRKEWVDGGKKDADAREQYLALYNKAAELYATFMHQYPESDYIYEFTFMMGEALFYSERYPEAIVQYKWVRDHRDLSEASFLDAAKAVLASYEAEADRQVQAKLIQPLKVPTSDEIKALPQPLAPQPIPEIYQQLQSEWDNYQNVVPDPKSAPQQGINAALVSLAYLHIDDAIVRLQKVMDKFCGSPEATRAKDSLLAIYDATGQLDLFQSTNNKFIATACGDAKSIELAKSQNRSIDFKRAVELSNQKKYIEAADAFYRFYKTAPAGDADLPTALYNSAVNYKLGERPKTAISLFKEFTQNKDKLFHNSPFYLEAMRLTALSYQGAFDYTSALAAYLDLYETAKTAKARGLKLPDPIPGEPVHTLEQVSLDALFNAAFVAELNRDFKKAVSLYSKYDKEETVKRNKDRALWSIARIYRSSGDVETMITWLDRWRAAYGADADNRDDYVESYYDTAKLWSKQKRTAKADAAEAATIKAWRDRGAVKNTTGATMAGEFALKAAEDFYNTKFAPAKLPESQSLNKDKAVEEIKVAQAKLEKLMVETQNQYKALDDYGVLELTMAAKVRFGDTLADYGNKRVNAPTPKYIVALDKKSPESNIAGGYAEQLGKTLSKYLDLAKQQWVDVSTAAKQGGVSNQWSQRALENLNREFPDEYPVLHQELFDGTEAP